MDNISNLDTEKMMLTEIGRNKVLTREQEKEMFIQYGMASGREKQKIKVKIINANMRFVLRVALQYSRKMSVELSELVSEGKFGLLIAIDLFDHTTENKFISFAVWHIKCKISKYLENSDLVRLPSHQKVKLNKAKKNSNYDDADDDIRYLWDITQAPMSFDTPVGEHDCVLGDIIGDDRIENFSDKHFRELNIQKIESIIGDVLDSDEIEVLSNLFGFESNEKNTLRQVSDIMGKSHERIRQIRDKALKKLKRNSNIRDLRDVFYQVIKD